MRRIDVVFGLVLLGCSAVVNSQTHGPFCSWHQDPTRTMTIQWIERIDMRLPGDTWFVGKAGFGQGYPDAGTRLAMADRYQQLAIRKQFDLPEQGEDDPELDLAGAKLSLTINFDDAFVAYLNGVEIARSEGMREDDPGKIATLRVPAHSSTNALTFDIGKTHRERLKPKGNILAVRGLNQHLDSPDFALDPRLTLVIGKETSKLIDKNASWQFLLGAPPEHWATEWSEAVDPPLLPSSFTPSRIAYGPRGGTLDRVHDANVRPFADTRQVVHSVTLENLSPGTAYAFQIQQRETGAVIGDGRYFFRTAPASSSEPVVFVTGGDMMHNTEMLDRMNRECGRQNPLFALLGGDLAYANGRDADRWYDWVDSWHRWSRTEDDYLVPMIAVIGNHECDTNIGSLSTEKQAAFDPRKHAKFYYSLFPLPEGRSNFVVDFADYLSVVCLDSDHTQTPAAQVDWLAETLERRRTVPNLFACYHKPTFGTLVKADHSEVRTHFVPLFDRYGVDAAFENDHHVYKRTLPLKQGRIHEAGTLYLGDGAWGVNTRTIPWNKVEALDYLVRGEPRNHLIRVSLFEDRQQFDAYDGEGFRFDSYARFR